MNIIKAHVDLTNETIAQTSCFTAIKEDTCIQPDANCTMLLQTSRGCEIIQSDNVINPDFKARLFDKIDDEQYYVTFVTNTNFNYKIGGNTLVGLDIDNNPNAKYYYRTIYVLKIIDHERFANEVLQYRFKEYKYFATEALENYVAPLFRTVIQDRLANLADDYGHAKVDRHNIELTNEIKTMLNKVLPQYGLRLVDIDPTRKGVDDEMIDIENKFKLR